MQEEGKDQRRLTVHLSRLGGCLASLQDATVPGGSSPPLASVSWALKCSPLAAAMEGLLLWYRACSAKGLFTS